MSVTFTLAQYRETPEHGTVLWMGPDHTHKCPEPAGECSDAELYFGQCEHADAARVACGCTALDVNLSNANAAAVLARLGIEFDPECIAGEAAGADLLGRALVANVGQDDSGDPSVSEGGPGTGRALMVDCGHRPGYFTDVMTRLAALATAADERGLMVGWA